MEKNKNIESITGDPKSAINKLAFPLVASLLLVMSNNLIDSIWVSGLGADPLAALGFVTPLFMILVGIGNGIGGGINSLLARYVGAKDIEKANEGASQSLVLSLIITIVLTLVIVVFLKDLLYIMGAESVMSYAIDYSHVLFVGSFSILLPEMLSGMFRAEGNIKRATVPMAVTAILNIILDPIFIYIFGLGIEGAAIATVIASTVSLLLLLYWMFIKKDTFFTYSFKNFKFKGYMIKDILNVGIPASLEEILMSAVMIIINLLVLDVAGTEAVAIYTAGWRLISMAIIPSIGVSTSAITVAGVNYGARNFDNLKTTVRYSAALGFGFSLVVGIIFFVFADPIASLFAYSSNSVGLAGGIAEFLRVMWVYVLPVAFGATAGYVFQGLGKGIISFIITILRELVFAVLFAYLFGITFAGGLLGIYVGLIFGTLVGSIVGYAYIEIFVNKLRKINP